jgi:Family of unknown function (DUF6152)
MAARLVGVLAVAMLMPLPLSAHHGGAAYEVGKPLTLKGTVTQWYYANPHCLLTLEVKGEDGTVVMWIAETQAPAIMYPAGYRRDTFKPGDQVTVIVEPAKNGRPIGHIREVVTAAGWTLGGGGQSTAKPPAAK